MTWGNRFGFDSIFDEITRSFQEAEEMMDRLFRTAKTWTPGTTMIQGPYLYGFSMTTGPDGRPVIQQFGNVRPSASGLVESGAGEPYVDVIPDERGETLKLVAEMPGVKKEDISIEALEGAVTIKAEHGDRKYYKELPLAVKIEPNSAKANYTNGVLELTLKLKEPMKPKGVNIKVD